MPQFSEIMQVKFCTRKKNVQFLEKYTIQKIQNLHLNLDILLKGMNLFKIKTYSHKQIRYVLKNSTIIMI